MPKSALCTKVSSESRGGKNTHPDQIQTRPDECGMGFVLLRQIWVLKISGHGFGHGTKYLEPKLC